MGENRNQQMLHNNPGQIVILNAEEMHTHITQQPQRPHGNDSAKIKWVRCSNGQVPHRAVPAGSTETGETFFSARAYHAGTFVPGKVHPSHRCCYIPYDGKEIVKQDYEVLAFEDN